MKGSCDVDVGTTAAESSIPPPLEWKFSQVFGERAAGEELQEGIDFLISYLGWFLVLLGEELIQWSWGMSCEATYVSFGEMLHFLYTLVDIISAIEFDKSGDHLATGDRGGRVVLFERTDVRHNGFRKDLEKQDCPITRHPEFCYMTEFQSHEPEFDYLKSLEIEEKINKIKWCQTVNNSLFLLSTNHKTIKYWKVQEKKVKKFSETNIDTSENGSIASASITATRFVPDGAYAERPHSHLSNDFSIPPGGSSLLRLPVATSQETSLIPKCRRIYAHAHDYHINSISTNSGSDIDRRFEISLRAGHKLSGTLVAIEALSRKIGPLLGDMTAAIIDCETFISADDLRINLWNLEINNQSFNIVDVKPANMEDLTEVITSAEFHPTHCNLLAYSSSKGSVRLIDLRQSSLCDNHSKIFEEREAPGSRSFFTEIITSISDIKFAKDGRHLLSRDYMTLKVAFLSSPLFIFPYISTFVQYHGSTG
ncbi:hypothetical protein ZIOFF_067727 [Zingiber officinale]|uniref:Serine/threonine-protein phosphatase 2A 55 kDa regulatory subunit B n=1 Tax=Zingiber officinale TaxID=94328 RepID=A0A8J5EE72_ZINOF|nr:hypothetical protein ZIOFF_067727 [Zingiber officinale]